MKQYIEETLHKDWGQFFKEYEIIHESKTEEQHLLLIETKSYGRVLILDDVVQVTEKDNFIYHELLTHIPIISHYDCRKVLVIGGGDGGMIKEIFKYPHIDITMVEIDAGVIEFSKQYLTSIHEGAFNNERVKIIIADGAKFVAGIKNEFDVIIVDSTDPIGPGQVLFTKEFYSDCKTALTHNGILVTQNGIPFTQPEELKHSVSYFKELFNLGTCYTGTIPTYVGGPMTFGFATDDDRTLEISEDTITKKLVELKIDTNYYNAEVHKAAFALPNYIKKLL